MARFGVRSGSLAFARPDEGAVTKRPERTGANIARICHAEGRGFESHHPLLNWLDGAGAPFQGAPAGLTRWSCWCARQLVAVPDRFARRCRTAAVVAEAGRAGAVPPEIGARAAARRVVAEGAGSAGLEDPVDAAGRRVVIDLRRVPVVGDDAEPAGGHVVVVDRDPGVGVDACVVRVQAVV